jgi:hypothetical protein
MSFDWQAKLAEQTEQLLKEHQKSELLELVIWPSVSASVPTITAFKSTVLTDEQLQHIEARFSSDVWDTSLQGGPAGFDQLRGDWKVGEALLTAGRLLTSRMSGAAESDELLAEMLLYAKHHNPELKRLTVNPPDLAEGAAVPDAKNGVELEYWEGDA